MNRKKNYLLLNMRCWSLLLIGTHKETYNLELRYFSYYIGIVSTRIPCSVEMRIHGETFPIRKAQTKSYKNKFIKPFYQNHFLHWYCCSRAVINFKILT